MTTTCCIAGCGPAGAVLGLLLARAGIDVFVLEKHKDFLRDFRGDTIHPSTLEILDEMGLADEFLTLPHSKVSNIELRTTAGQTVRFSFQRLPTKFRYLAFVPQWDFLEFITRHAARYRGFTLLRNAEAVGLVESNGVVTGVRYRDAGGEHELPAVLTVGADGRDSRTREAAGLQRVVASPPMDVLWFRVTKPAGEGGAVAARLGAGRVLVMLDRREYYQIAYVIPKGKAGDVLARPIEHFRRDIAAVAPELADRVDQIRDWDQVKLLTVRADRLLRWHKPGYLAIGDAAHAMSPIGGVGINVAIHDAVAAANILWRPLLDRRLTDTDLHAVQRKREQSVRIMQALQSFLQNRFLKVVLDSKSAPSLPWPIRMLTRLPLLREIPPRIIGLGINRPHVEIPAAGG